MSEVDEAALVDPQDTPATFVVVAARAKARAVAADQRTSVVIGADTVVEFDGTLLGKPRDRSSAEQTLRALRGAQLRVHTAQFVVFEGREASARVTTFCQLREFDQATLDRYLESETWKDKAAGLAMQHRSPDLVAAVQGCVPSALGLATCRIPSQLRAVGIDPTDLRTAPDELGCPGVGCDGQRCELERSAIAR